MDLAQVAPLSYRFFAVNIKTGIADPLQEPIESGGLVDVSVLVKALNEESKIEACLASVFQELDGLNGEVILVDSLSEDRTIEIAKQFPIKIVQFLNRADCGPGAAVELGYRHTTGDFVYVLDGDMVLEPGFLSEAIQWLQEHPNYAGVAGVLTDTSLVNHEDRRRAANRPSATPGDVHSLAGGGLYRRVAIEELAYLAHRSLRAFEEAELGMRLRAKGWKLHRLMIPGVRHTGHAIGTLALISRHWKSRRLWAGGVLLRAAIGHSYFQEAVTEQKYPIIVLIAWLSAGVGAVFNPNLSFLILIFILFVAFVALLYKKGLSDAVISYLSWHILAISIVFGFMSPIDDPNSRIPTNSIN